MEPTFSFPNTIQDVICSNDVDLERLLQMETNLMDFDFIDQDGIMGLDKGEYAIFGHETEQKVQQSVEFREFEDNSNSSLKGIRDELMEESSLTDLLLTGAEAVEAENWPLASTVIERLKTLLFYQENGDEPFHRLALFFTQGLHYKSIKHNSLEVFQEPVWKQDNSISAFQMLQELSPYVKFAHFTANQAILEATEGDNEVHVIDFDIMEGVQWPPLMIDLALRKDFSFHITAIIDHEQNSGRVQQTGRRLQDFADSVSLKFVFDHMVMEKEEHLEGIEVGCTLIANCMTHQLHMPYRGFSMVNTFLGGVSKLSPKIVVLVEEDLFRLARTPSISFVEFFCEALHHYNALIDSLTSGFCGGYKLALRVIEKEFLGNRILDCLRQFPRDKKENFFGKDGYASLKGFRQIPMSSCNVSQARFLVSLFSGGYWVQHEECKLALCWNSRPLTIASIWVPISNPRRPASSTSF
ncbi:protein NODULATION SIGNALING PATHWAY 2-like [Actinidia eriantha]|uniref:protein NODULATION SIGNALING PATHWAY 2-like n=1 Tax=Actinidia eriantha TaxID=165200 RepID=UPI0025827219|nr:protein NODULATION SIGNALING PATHWAY 2-like [Actinidia eriantha]